MKWVGGVRQVGKAAREKELKDMNDRAYNSYDTHKYLQ